MSGTPIRIGIVGAGANTRLMHIPGFQTQEGVEVVSVSNRSRASSQQVADQFGIPIIYDKWTDLVDADDTNAICIGTWPYMHCPVTLRALARGKHVLTEARMAMSAAEARTMLAASREHPDLVTQIVPSPFTFRVDQTVRDLLNEGYLGDILAIELLSSGGAFLDTEGPLHWRQDRDLSGYNILTMGIWYEALMRWVGPATRVSAMTRVWVRQRKDGDGTLRATTIPDHVDALCDMACGAQAHLRISAVMGLHPTDGIWLYGSQGTLHWDAASGKLYGGQRGDQALAEVHIPSEREGRWRVEEEFVGAIRGQEPVRLTSFEDGVRYMEFTEAVTRSAQSGQAVALPLGG